LLRIAVARIERTDVQIPLENDALRGLLSLPAEPIGAVVFAHGSGSGRNSPRNKYVAQVLNDAGLATLLFDLLTADEERVDLAIAHLRFDIDLLAERLMTGVEWVRREPRTSSLALGLFGASTGAAAALQVAARAPDEIDAVVSRGGRPDLALDHLPRVTAPTLLIVGGADHQVIPLNQQALDAMTCERAMELVPGATHLFEENGALEQAARLAADWFARHLAASTRASRGAG
jgi:dienelactone hydrolase